MPTANELPESARVDAMNRMLKIEGQLRGIRTMIESGRDCVQVLDQLAAARAGINKLSANMYETVALYCARNADEFESAEDQIEHITRLLIRSGK